MPVWSRIGPFSLKVQLTVRVAPDRRRSLRGRARTPSEFDILLPTLCPMSTVFVWDTDHCKTSSVARRLTLALRRLGLRGCGFSLALYGRLAFQRCYWASSPLPTSGSARDVTGQCAAMELLQARVDCSAIALW